MKRKVNLYCIECGKFLGEFYGYVAQESLIEGEKHILCPSPQSVRDEQNCCQDNVTMEREDRVRAN